MLYTLLFRGGKTKNFLRHSQPNVRERKNVGLGDLTGTNFCKCIRNGFGAYAFKRTADNNFE